MKKMFFTFLLLTQYLMGLSQFSDDFSDGNLTSNSNLTVKVTRDYVGNWELFVDTSRS